MGRGGIAVYMRAPKAYNNCTTENVVFSSMVFSYTVPLGMNLRWRKSDKKTCVRKCHHIIWGPLDKGSVTVRFDEVIRLTEGREAGIIISCASRKDWKSDGRTNIMVKLKSARNGVR